MELSLLGSVVQVVVDRPLGSYHPKHHDIYYPINYGYIPDTMAGDGEPVDAYILGVDEPVQKYTGKVIAVIHRLNDVEGKLVVASPDKLFSKEEIAEAVRFQEQYFHTEIICDGLY